MSILAHTPRLDRAIGAGRARVGAHVPAVIFLASYALTTLLGNLLYCTSVGVAMAQRLNPEFSLREFAHFGSPGYWALLVLPLLVVPPTAAIAFRLARPGVEYTFRHEPFEIGISVYVLLSVLFQVYCTLVVYNQDVVELNVKAHDVLSSLQARFLILERLGFAFRIIVNSALPVLVIYALLRTLASRSAIWAACFIVNAVSTSIYLILLNMRWPILVLWITIFLAWMLHSKKHLFYKLILVTGTCLLAYLMVSALVFRMGATAPQSSQGSQTAAGPDGQRPGALSGGQIGRQVLVLVTEGLGNAARLFTIVINRMAWNYPIYYEEFTSHGFVCGTLWDRLARRQVPCSPSTYLFQKTTHPDDPLKKERGTLPAAVNVSGYALGGWITAAMTTLIAGAILGIFAAFGAVGPPSATRATVWVMGAQVGYFFSQLPVEGPLVYDHGAFWWGGLLLLGSGVSVGLGALERRAGGAVLWSPQRTIVVGLAVLFVILCLAAVFSVPGVWDAFWPGDIRS